MHHRRWHFSSWSFLFLWCIKIGNGQWSTESGIPRQIFISTLGCSSTQYVLLMWIFIHRVHAVQRCLHQFNPWADWCTSSMHETSAKIGHMCSMKKWFKIQRKMEIICVQWSSWMGPSSLAMDYVGTVWRRNLWLFAPCKPAEYKLLWPLNLATPTSQCYVIWIVQNYGYLVLMQVFLLCTLLLRSVWYFQPVWTFLSLFRLYKKIPGFEFHLRKKKRTRDIVIWLF